MKRDLIIGAFALLLVITIALAMSTSEIKDTSREIQEKNNKLVQTVTTLEKDLKESLDTAEELKEKNIILEKDVISLKFNMAYKDFNDAINTIESYKKAKTFEDAKQFVISRVGFYSMDQEENCPCGFIFSGNGLEWRPNVILELNKFTIENGRILLTYHTAKEIDRDYQFILTNEEGWKIEDIKLKKK